MGEKLNKHSKFAAILRRLLFEHNIRVTDLAREVDLPQPTIHRFVTGKSTRPYKSSLKPIADYFSISIPQLLGEEPLENQKDVQHSKHTNKNVPIIPWEQLSESSLHSLSNVETILVANVSDYCFASKIQDSSMDPIFPCGTTLIFDKQKEPKDRAYILVKLHDSELCAFRQVIIDGSNYYLKPLNPDLSKFSMRLLDDKDKLLGVLIEARHNFELNL